MIEFGSEHKAKNNFNFIVDGKGTFVMLSCVDFCDTEFKGKEFAYWQFKTAFKTSTSVENINILISLIFNNKIQVAEF